MMSGPVSSMLRSRCYAPRSSSPFPGLHCFAPSAPPPAGTTALPLVSSFLSIALFSNSRCIRPSTMASFRASQYAAAKSAATTMGRTAAAPLGQDGGASISSAMGRGSAAAGAARQMSSSSSGRNNPFAYTIRYLPGTNKKYYDLNALGDDRLKTLPFSIRVLLESAVRNCDGTNIREEDVQAILAWKEASKQQREIPFMPARVLLQDFTGVPAVVDLAAMRDAMRRLGGDPQQINPLVDVDLVIDHSVQVDYSRTPDALQQNLAAEMKRNAERFAFLKWGSKAFSNMLIVPPGSGIVHQVNLEYLARVVMQKKKPATAAATAGSSAQQQDGSGSSEEELLYPDSVVGTDSHTTMINGLGVVGWGVGGIEAEAVMLGQQISMVLPQVVGFELKGEMPPHVTATDLVLTVTNILRKKGVVGKFVEFYGPGVQTLTLADRATVANMAPEYGATMGFFPVDAQTLQYLQYTGRGVEKVSLVEQYTRASGLFAGQAATAAAEQGGDASFVAGQAAAGHEGVIFSDYCSLDLSSLEPCVAGPKRPQDRVVLSRVKEDFLVALTSPVGFKGYGLSTGEQQKKVTMRYRDGKTYTLHNGSVVIAAITSCTNTSNPGVILGAGLLARKALQRGLSVAPYIVTTLSPGSRAVTEYLEQTGLLKDLEQLRFFTAGYGCMTCIGNTGDFDAELTAAITEGDLVVAAVLSGNRNFEGRVHPMTRANYLASPPLVVAYALAGRVDFDFQREPLGRDHLGKEVFLRDIWPSRQEIAKIEQEALSSSMFTRVYEHISKGTKEWNDLQVPASTDLFAWDEKSTYIHNPPFFQTMEREAEKIKNIEGAYCLLNLGDSITTDHISPAGNIAVNSPAAVYLRSRGIERKDFNTYGSRRGNDEVMVRGTFANIRLVNKMCPKDGPKAVHVPTGDVLPVYDVAMRYLNEEQRPQIILAGKEYGSGSSRDWAAKGPYLMGVKAIIAESFERIHRTNLVGMGILPMQFLSGQTADSLALTGKEQFDIDLNEGNLVPGALMKVRTRCGKTFDVRSRIDTDLEVKYFMNGGILRYVLRSLVQKHAA